MTKWKLYTVYCKCSYPPSHVFHTQPGNSLNEFNFLFQRYLDFSFVPLTPTPIFHPRNVFIYFSTNTHTHSNKNYLIFKFSFYPVSVSVSVLFISLPRFMVVLFECRLKYSEAIQKKKKWNKMYTKCCNNVFCAVCM